MTTSLVDYARRLDAAQLAENNQKNAA